MRTAINKCPFCGGRITRDSNVMLQFSILENGLVVANDIDREEIEQSEEEKLKIVLGGRNVKLDFHCADCGESLWGKLVSKKSEPIRLKLWPVLEEE